MNRNEEIKVLREYPYQVIAYLEDKLPPEFPLHCTLARRFELAPDVSIDEIIGLLRDLKSLAGLTEIVLLKPAHWDVDNTYISPVLTDQLKRVWREVNQKLEGTVEFRDKAYNTLGNLHVSFDTDHKKTLRKSNYRVCAIGLQIDYKSGPSEVALLARV